MILTNKFSMSSRWWQLLWKKNRIVSGKFVLLSDKMLTWSQMQVCTEVFPMEGRRFSVRHIKNFGDLPCCHLSAYIFYHPHPQCIIVVFPNGPKKALSNGWGRWVVCGEIEIITTAASRAIPGADKLFVWVTWLSSMSTIVSFFGLAKSTKCHSNKPLIGHPTIASGVPPFVNSMFTLFRLHMTIGTKVM